MTDHMTDNPLPARTWGPYTAEEDTLREPMPQTIRRLHDSSLIKSGDPDRLVRTTVMRHLLDACADAQNEVGDYDRRILAWLSDWDYSAAQVVIGLIRRAHASATAPQHSRNAR